MMSDSAFNPNSRTHSPAHPPTNRGDESPSSTKVDSRQAEQRATPAASNLASLKVRCPHCHNPIHLGGDELLSDLQCLMCGSHFSLLREDETVAFDESTRRRIGNFELLEPVGTGQFGTVWKARDLDLDRIVAVKIPRQSRMGAADVERFIREARAAAQTRHPNIVGIHEIGREADWVYIVTDFVDGVTLSQSLAFERLTIREAVELCIKIAEALDAAHAAGVVHRDLKPSNVMVDRQREPFITDFGLAKRDCGEVTMTVDGAIMGTPAYMSPEQAQGNAHLVDRRADIYSLGVILYELLTGERPFRGDTRMLVLQILRDDPVSPCRLNSRIPRELETVCLKCLEKEPERRYPSAGELAADLKRLLRGEPICAKPTGALHRAWQWYRRHPDASMKVAGTASTVCAVLFTVWELHGLVMYSLGIGTPPDLRAAVVGMVSIIVVVNMPLLCAGIATLNGHLWGLGVGALICSAGLFASAVFLCGIVTLPTLTAEALLPTMSLVLNLCAFGVVAHFAAIVFRFGPKGLGH